MKRALTTIWWWIATLFVLAVLDDLTFGPFFWAIARTAGPAWSFGLVLAVYVPVQVWLVARGTAEAPGRVAGWFLDRLYLDRRASAVARNEERIRTRVIGAGSAFLLSPLIGGVLPPLILHARGLSTGFVRKLSWVTATIYAVTFGLLHGILPSVF